MGCVEEWVPLHFGRVQDAQQGRCATIQLELTCCVPGQVKFKVTHMAAENRVVHGDFMVSPGVCVLWNRVPPTQKWMRRHAGCTHSRRTLLPLFCVWTRKPMTQPLGCYGCLSSFCRGCRKARGGEAPVSVSMGMPRYLCGRL